MTDIVISDGLSVFLLKPLTLEGRDWLEDNVGKDSGFQPYWPTAVVECRYVDIIFEAMINDGLSVTVVSSCS